LRQGGENDRVMRMSEENTTPDLANAALEQSLKRCRPEVISAAKEYRNTKDAKLLPMIVVGVLERYVEPERRGLFAGKNTSELKLQADLGMDSLVMVEVVMTLEEVLSQQIPDTELRGLVTIEDTLAYVNAKATGAPLPEAPDRPVAEMVNMLLGDSGVLIRDVVLRPAKAEAVYSGAEPKSADSLMTAAGQLLTVWGSRKNEPQASSPKTTGTVAIDEALPVQLRIEKAAAGWNAFYLQTGKEAVQLGTV